MISSTRSEGRSCESTARAVPAPKNARLATLAKTIPYPRIENPFLPDPAHCCQRRLLLRLYIEPLTLLEAAGALRKRKISSVELTRLALDRITRMNPALNAFLTVTKETAWARARALDQELADGIDRGSLHGIPIAHKDCFATKGVRTTDGSKILARRVPDHDAEVVAQLDRAGAVMLGKTNLHELCYGITSNNPHFGAVHNPWNLERIPGGSSGGSAAAVAAGMVFAASGTDTGGSIRIPASFCGVVGLKPTYGRLSRRGVMPLGLTLDHVGPIARNVRDTAACFRAMAGEASVPETRAGVEGLRIG